MRGLRCTCTLCFVNKSTQQPTPGCQQTHMLARMIRFRQKRLMLRCRKNIIFRQEVNTRLQHESPPPLPRLLAQVLVCLLLFDFQSFVWHLVHHRVPWLYRHFHKVHHTFSSTSALTTEYSGVWETLSLGFFAAANPVLLGCHPLTELAFFLLNIWLSVEDHCGYDLPWATHRLVPFGLYGGARHHDLHHLNSRCNYAPYFTHWDRLAGTLQTPQD